MAKKFYCSKCGVELTLNIKAIPGKGFIVNLIEPHNCEGYAVKSNEGENPTVLDIINSLKPISPINSKEDKDVRNLRPFNLKDQRQSSVPTGIIKGLGIEDD